MKSIKIGQFDQVLAWCASVVGPLEVVSDHSREHPGERASAARLRTPAGLYYLKTHQDPSHWHSEVHGYECWAPAFGNYAARLVAVREEEPLALLISELPGKVLEETPLPAAQECDVWRAAGQALAGLHNLPAGASFGPCRRDGTCAGQPIADAGEYIASEISAWMERGLRGGFLDSEEQAILRAARRLIPAFESEPALACHRDYCPANWLVTPDGRWSGVIDFEFSYWDVRVADFTRDPGWHWISQPEVLQAFCDGYGLSITPQIEQQILAGHVNYALTAIVWGEENAYFGFAREGRQALRRAGKLLRDS